MELIPKHYDLAALTMDALAALVAGDRPVVILLPVGCVEPHGPHLSLLTDTVISHSAAIRAVAQLERAGMAPLIAPPISYGVTDCAQAFSGAVSVSATALSGFLRDVVTGFLANNISHVCLINNHLEPAQYAAVRDAISTIDAQRASVACPLKRRWARTLSDEFRRGACHAGQYETSIMLAADPDLVDQQVASELPEVPVSLSEKLQSGVADFVEMGLSQAYAGTPAQATAAEGTQQLEKLAAMITAEICESLADGSD